MRSQLCHLRQRGRLRDAPGVASRAQVWRRHLQDFGAGSKRLPPGWSPGPSLELPPGSAPGWAKSAPEQRPDRLAGFVRLSGPTSARELLPGFAARRWPQSNKSGQATSAPSKRLQGDFQCGSRVSGAGSRPWSRGSRDLEPPGSSGRAAHTLAKATFLSFIKAISEAVFKRFRTRIAVILCAHHSPFRAPRLDLVSWRPAQRRPSAAGAAISAAPEPLLPPSGRSHHSTRCCCSGLHCRAGTVTRPLRWRRRWRRWQRR